MPDHQKKVLPYGLWPSPVSASLISSRVRLEDVAWSPDGETLVWTEGRSGASTLLAQTGCAARRELTDENAPRGSVGYGGGVFTVGAGPDGQATLVFADRDGRLYRRGLGFERPQAITPAVGGGAVASPALSGDGRWLLYVYSDGRTDLLGLAASEGADWPDQFARGADFYMQPTWHPEGRWAAWVAWNHPNMPWDGARVQLARLEGQPPRAAEARTVAGGEDQPASQPHFSPDGRWLSFIEESGEWPNLVILDLQSGQRRVLVEGDGFELALPAWVQGVRSTGWNHDASRIYYLRYQGPFASLWYVAVDSGQSRQIEMGPYTWLSQLSVSPTREAVACLASAPTLPDQIIQWDEQGLQVVARSAAEMVAPEVFSTPREISWQAPDGQTVYGLYYPPSNPDFTGQGLPPAILNIHGGPTSLAGARFDGEGSYFTSRGYAWVEVNYRGSTGYGRSYRNALRQRWGEADVEDAAGCARALTDQGLADPKRLVIWGGSAGGYTVLNALIHYPGLFKAGLCLYGVSNLFTLDLDTHKFEERYNASLVGPMPEAAPRYRAWSPVFHAEQIEDPLYVFQGDQDKVVPPSQSEEIVAALRQRGVPIQYKLYEGEGHGFRKSETIADYLKEAERFLQQYVLFTD